jgi:hypothetical protein
MGGADGTAVGCSGDKGGADAIAMDSSGDNGGADGVGGTTAGPATSAIGDSGDKGGAEALSGTRGDEFGAIAPSKDEDDTASGDTSRDEGGAADPAGTPFSESIIFILIVCFIFINIFF